ncbi:MAG: SusC/RagA family TonB-linked outer membrane protein [Bacteroidetes bacterium GWF2_42_66]|nr:MAG: SusC/RagA family TonB-linked outer membrane protein [Bacteroidetes bacterium GWA2_42_15]OFX96555.1 MAG: SusC/RagA family TonB-linked outer membrane protein [Bacteroidetes bacterium GWE2_42_39]OFY40974.1 MAG: SusC/RagA family TonB-linked outer membrane protein [Bacteroidetes bacterium GWF2_42_66]
MKLTSFLLFVMFCQVSATVFSQNNGQLSLKAEQKTISGILQLIEDQSDYSFMYNSNNIDVNRKADINYNGKSIEEVLDILFKGTNVKYRSFNSNYVLYTDDNSVVPAGQMQQAKSVSGKIIDFSGQALPGVTVVVKGTTNGTITDPEGKYSLSQIPANSILVFSFVGMKTQEIQVADKPIINVTMEEDAIGIEEVVAVGYGTQKKANLTGSVSAVKIDDKIASRSLTNVSSGLQGLLPGLAINQNSGMAGKNDVTMLIRGLGTVNNANPLVVVDGMPDVDINRLNMNDIESVSVLKDATSSAVYGSRAANGVILITTKSGKGTNKPRLNISSSYAVGVPTQSIDFMDDYARALTIQNIATSTTTKRPDLTYKDGSIDQWLALGMIDPLQYPNTDWWDVMVRNSTVQNHNVSASSSNEKSNFFISVGVMDEKGLQINNNYSLYNARFNYDYKIRKNINVGIKFNGNWSKVDFANGEGFNDASGFGFKFGDAASGVLPYDPETGNYGGAMAYNETTSLYNPYSIYNNQLNRQNRQEANTSMYLDWSPVKGLSARVDYALSYYNQFRYYAPIPNTLYNFQTGSYTPYSPVAKNAGISNYTNTGYKTQLNGRLEYQTTFAKHHNLSALFVYSEEYWYDRYQASSRLDRIHPTLSEIDAALPDTQTANGNSSTEGLQSYIGRINYSAFDKYLFEVNFRYDGSSKFLSGSRFGFFPSASAGWRFTEENFINPHTRNWLSSGKLRASYGGLGNNSGIGRYQQQEILAQSNYNTNGNTAKGFTYRQMVNKNLSWESTYVFNLGLDLGFLNNHLTAEIDYYDRFTTGMLRPSDLSTHLTGAYDAPYKNIGDLRNRGIEGNLIWKGSKGDFAYSINLNASYNATRLEKWNEFLNKGNVFLDMPYYFVYSYEAIGIAQTWEDVYKATPQGASPGDILLKDLNGDGQITAEDKKAYSQIQRSRPTTNYAVNFNANWKGFDMTILLQGTAGRKDFWLTNWNSTNIQSYLYPSSWDHWSNPWSWSNRNGAWPRLDGSNLNEYESTFWLDDMSYVRLKNVQLGYTLPNNLVKKLRIDNVRFYISGENLATFTKFRGIDPEKNTNADDAYPLVKSFAFGVNIGI